MGKDNELMTAVKNANRQNVRKILQKYRKSHKKNSHKKSNINNADADGFTVLHHAALYGDVEIVMAIVEMEGDPNSTDHKGMTPLHMAAWAGKDGPVKALLESRALPNLPSYSGDTPLHLAAQHGYATCTKVLLSFHADGSFRNDNKETPLDLACQYGHTAVVKQLITDDKVKQLLRSPMTDQRYKSPLHLSAKSGHDDIVHLLLQGGAKVNETRVEGTPLHQAALYGKTDVVRLLLRAGADASVKNSHGLMALDLVNRFTTSRAGLEIKQMLREAAGDRVAYARAVSDYNNQFDETCLSFKVGDSVAVIEQNEDGRWRGYVVNSEAEKIGFFPAMAVQVITKAKNTHSVSSTSSQASMESGNGSIYASSIVSSHDKRTDPGSPAPQPVGVVPIGSFEVVTLAQANPEFHAPPKQTASGSIPPRMSSFKQKKGSRQSSPKLPCSHQSRYSQNTSQYYQTNSEQAKKMCQRSKSEDRSRRKHENLSPNVLKRISPNASPVARSRGLSTGAVQFELAKQMRQQQDSMKFGIPDHHSTIYADVEIIAVTSQTEKSLPAHVTNYSTMYFSDQSDGPEKNKGSISANNTDNESINGSVTSSNDNKSPTIKPILVKSKSNDSNKTSDTEGSIKNSNSVTFAESPETINLVRMHSGHELINSLSQQEQLSPQLKTKPIYTRSHHERTEDFAPNNYLTMKRPPASASNLEVLESGGFTDALSLSNYDEVKFPSDQRLNEDDQKVLDWLIELKLASYFYVFQSHGFDMISIRAITPEDLSIMKITKTGHRKKLLSEIAKLPPSNDLPRIKPDDVGSWLARLNLHQYKHNFIEGGFDDIDFLKDLDKNDLDMIDIKKKGHQKKILMAVQQLSDLELTAILDEVVAETPIRRGLSINGRNYSDQILQEFFPSNFPNIVIASSTQQAMSTDVQSKHLPTHCFPSIVTKANGTTKISPPVVARKTSGGIAPKTKPKPVRTNFNGYLRGSSSESLNGIASLGTWSLNSSGEIQGDQEEIVSSSKSRNFFKEQERKASLSSNGDMDRKPSLTSLSSFDGSPSNTIKRNDATGLPPKLIPSISEYEKPISKPPPPAPPKRMDSIRNGEVNGFHPTENDVPPALPAKLKTPDKASPISPIFPSPPFGFTMPSYDISLPPTIETSSIVSTHETNGNSHKTISSLDISSPAKKDSIDEAFGSTDDLLSDLMADIDDFSAQLDAMF